MTPVFANLFEPEKENPEVPTPDNEKKNPPIVVSLNGMQYTYDCVCNGGCYPPCYDAPDGKCDQSFDCPNNCYC